MLLPIEPELVLPVLPDAPDEPEVVPLPVEPELELEPVPPEASDEPDVPLPVEPEPVVPEEPEVLPLLPIEPELLLPEVPDDPVEPVEGLVDDEPGVVVLEVSAFLLQPASASAATRASAAAVPVFSVDACMRVPLKRLERLTSSHKPIYLFDIGTPHETPA